MDELTVGLGNKPVVVVVALALSVQIRWIQDVHNCESFLFRESIMVRAVVVAVVVVVRTVLGVTVVGDIPVICVSWGRRLSSWQGLFALVTMNALTRQQPIYHERKIR